MSDNDKQRVTISVDLETVNLMRIMGIEVTGGKLGRQCSAMVAANVRKAAQERGLLPGDIPVISSDPKIMAKQLDDLNGEIVGLHRVLGQKVALAKSLTQELSRPR